MGITVEFKDYEEMLAFARVLLGGTDTPATIPVKKSIEESIPAEVAPVDDSQAEVAPTYTLEEVRAKLTALTRAGKQKEVRGILDSFKAKNVTALDPRDYSGVMEKAGAI